MSHSRARGCRPAWRVALTAIALGSLTAPAASASPAERGPAGDGFYAPPSELVAGSPGSVVWERPASAFTTPRGAARATTVLYRSVGVDGAPTVVSGDVLLPAGRPPAGGWPIVAWGHVTTGAADICAPTRATPAINDHGRMVRSAAVASLLLARGVAVVRTDFEGLGTPGRHPYLVGRSLARATVDMVRAARALEPTLASRYVAAGHSEGGVAALFTGATSRALAPELELRGVAAVAPVVAMRPLFELGAGLDLRIPDATALAGLVIDGVAATDPAFDAAVRAGGLSARALARLPQLQERCYGDLTRRDSLGGLTPKGLNGPSAGVMLPRLLAALDASDAAALAYARDVPIRIDQGDLDPVTWRPYADAFVRRVRRSGTPVTYRTYGFGTHANITDADLAAPQVAAWAAARLAPR